MTDHSLGYQARWIDTKCRKWLENLEVSNIVFTPGNHDLIFERDPGMIDNLPWTYLQDSGARTIGGLSIWGSPYQLPFGHNWAFNAEEPGLRLRWAAIPDDTDVLIVHGPPYGIGDWSPYDNVHTGSFSLLERIDEIKPRLVCCGHIHSGYGRYWRDETLIVNAALCDEAYRPVNPVIIVEIEGKP